jgi:hypothetical protein
VTSSVTSFGLKIESGSIFVFLKSHSTIAEDFLLRGCGKLFFKHFSVRCGGEKLREVEMSASGMAHRKFSFRETFSCFD